ncbi:DUF2203 domain-containing protein [Ferviditalea candida]|uniref:DUF2203 domain-containing protein n=1 Tax=Ferviditalea candida TaxID=3108399 RepID=A0ABU5ZEZ4_9BACL|nr:DUF2203 domain-containing protein [Paenibacillaceae bacterium T2]
MKKYFTVEEANALIPAVNRDLTRLQDITQKFEEKLQIRELLISKKLVFQGSPDVDPVFTLECEMDFLQMEANMLIQSIRSKGADLKDIETGLVDFPSKIGAEEVLLCWKQGEERIRYYHGLFDGFVGRRPLDEA